MTGKEINELSNRIRAKRIELNYSYLDLANITGISKSTLQRYETGFIKKIPIQQIKLLATALNISPSYLIGWEEENKTTETYKCETNNNLVTLGRLAEKANAQQLSDIIKYTKFILSHKDGDELDENI